MSKVTCSRCEEDREGLAKPPFRGEMGGRIHASVCGGCWVAWLEEQKKEMNEHRLSMMNPEHQERLLALMQTFLGLKEPS
jgi:Fe-S cluster biosynthesis and repair protein YggX